MKKLGLNLILTLTAFISFSQKSQACDRIALGNPGAGDCVALLSDLFMNHSHAPDLGVLENKIYAAHRYARYLDDNGNPESAEEDLNNEQRVGIYAGSLLYQTALRDISSDEEILASYSHLPDDAFQARPDSFVNRYATSFTDGDSFIQVFRQYDHYLIAWTGTVSQLRDLQSVMTLRMEVADLNVDKKFDFQPMSSEDIVSNLNSPLPKMQRFAVLAVGNDPERTRLSSQALMNLVMDESKDISARDSAVLTLLKLNDPAINEQLLGLSHPGLRSRISSNLIQTIDHHLTGGGVFFRNQDLGPLPFQEL